MAMLYIVNIVGIFQFKDSKIASQENSNGRSNDIYSSDQTYLTLCAYDKSVLNTMVLAYMLRQVGSKYPLHAMVWNVNDLNKRILELFGVKTLEIPDKISVPLGYLKQGEEPTERDRILWTKLYAWTLTQFKKVVLMDYDLVVLKNIDELFDYPEFAASPMVDPNEKIVFYEPLNETATMEDWFKFPFTKLDPKWKDSKAQLGVGKLGLNSGLVTLVPSYETFSNMTVLLSRLKQRTCCPTQEFLFRYFESKKSYTRLPPELHLRRADRIKPREKAEEYLRNAKVYHYVSKKKIFDKGYIANNDRISSVWFESLQYVTSWLEGLGGAAVELLDSNIQENDADLQKDQK